MTLYETVCNVNDKIIKGEEIKPTEKQIIINDFLKNIASKDEKITYQKKFKNNQNMYPYYYIPPFNNGKKLRLISGFKPKTEILSSNHFELEILRILSLWAGENEIVKDMVNKTIIRLDKTCFGHYCSKGDCIGASVVSLRFLNTVCPKNNEWIKELFEPLVIHFIDQKGMAAMKNYFPFFYFCLVLSELPIEMVKKYIIEKKEFLKKLLTRGNLIGPAENDTFNIILTYIIRNVLSRLNEFEHIKNEEIYIKDNRCYCKI